MADNESSEEEIVRNADEEESTTIDGIVIPTFLPPPCLYDDKPKGPRLIITKIDNNFFKSYAKNEVLGPFHRCFNGIIGPNGSGKSNVIDSLLFVFGYRATKIRCKKLSVLIHNSEVHSNVVSCQVTVHFALITEDQDAYEIVPDSEFTVSRTANKDNSSYYELQGRRVQFKEISNLLKKHGIDLDHNRFLILQGEVEQISMLKPKAEKDGETGMLEYLEDIIGTERYKKPLEQLQERVEILSERRIEKLNRLKLAEKEVNELEKPMEEAVHFLKMENTIIRNKNILMQINIKEYQLKIDVEKQNSEEILNMQNVLMTKLKELEEKRKIHTETQNKEVQEYEDLKSKKESLKEQYNSINKKDVQLQADMVNRNNLRKKTKELINSEKNKLSKLENLPEENEKTIKELEIKINQTTVEKEKSEADKSAALIKIQTETSGLQQKKSEIQTELAVLKEAVDKTKSAFNLAETQLKVCVANEENEKSKLEKLKQVCETSEQTIQKRSHEIKDLKEKIATIDKSIRDANCHLLKVKEEERNLVNMIRSNRTKLEESKSSVSASKSRGKVLNALMEEKHKGTCPGLFGRLGDLGAIDEKYDVAVSTACGPLDNIVVDTVDCAQWCIEFLKKYNIGRAIFIALDKQEHLRPSATTRIQTPENVHRLYDLIKVNDERVRTAFYYALRDTLVANDLEQASRIAYGARRYRVVTLKGDLIEVTGTMSGGGTRTLRGRMGQSVAVSTQSMSTVDINKLEHELQLAEKNLEKVRKDQNEFEMLIETKNPELNQIKINYQKFNQELQSLRQQQPSLKHQLVEQQQRVNETKTDDAKVKELTGIVERTKQEYQQASQTADILQVQVDAITKDIKKITSDRMGKIDKKLKETTNLIEKCKSEITRLTVQMKTARRNYTTTEENIARMQQDVEEMENNLRAMKEERQEIEEEAKKLLANIEETTEQLGEKEKTYLSVKKEVEEIIKEENAIKSEKIDIDAKVKKIEKTFKDYNITINALKSKLSNLKYHKIPNETLEEIKSYTDEELEEQNIQTLQKEIHQAENHLKAAKPNLNAIQDYEKKRDVYVERSRELDEIVQKRREMNKLLDQVRQQRREEFTAGFKIIKLKLKEIYQMITLGGDADLEVIDTYDPFADGIEFNVRPPKKTWKKISNLSGGEKTLSSLALVFALHYYKPSPLYVLDEIDAALDFKNVSIIGNYIKEQTKNAQFFIISLRPHMTELSDRLTGIYKVYHTTKSMTINPALYANANSDEINPDESLVSVNA